ncbi:MAG: hypothetical protein EBR45_08545 [Betaproteobacteria bacterium]|nr:hypothetical protein [Betaproteobacteria bacterium]
MVKLHENDSLATRHPAGWLATPGRRLGDRGRVFEAGGSLKAAETAFNKPIATRNSLRGRHLRRARSPRLVSAREQIQD